MTEESILKAVSADNIRAHVDHIINEIPSRLAGSENGKRMAEYSAKALEDCGVSAVVHELPGLVSFPRKAELRILSPTEYAIEANTLGHSVPTLKDGMSGELLYVGSGGFEDYVGKEAVGKITLSELSYSPARHEKQRIAGMKGSTGAVMMNWGHAENEAVPFGSVKPVWGNPTPDNYSTEMPTIPCIGIARTAGLQLKEMCGQGPVRAWFRTDVDNGWYPVQITVGQITVPTSDDFVLVGGHQDSWYGEASTDNAAGNACIYELARVFNEHRNELRRGLKFGFWTGHETGTMVGSSWYADQNWDTLRKHAVAYLQIDQPSCTGTTIWASHSNAELKRLHDPIEERLLGNIPRQWHRVAKNGDSSFFGMGIPMMHAQGGFTDEELDATANATLGWWHHSVECRMDKLDWEFMETHIKMYAAYLWELCTAPVLPFGFVSVSEQFIDRLEELTVLDSTIGLDTALDQAKQFRKSVEQFDKTAGEWRLRYEGKDSLDESPAHLLNACMKKLSRILVPMQSTAIGTYGHDPYGYTPQTTMIPALYGVLELASLKKNDEARWMMETKLVRERNRVTDALVDAKNLVDETLKNLG